MKMKLFMLLLLGLCIGVFPASLYAGVEPSPFQPEKNQLEAVVNVLNSCLDRVQKVLVPPNPIIIPGPALNGAVNKLEAIDRQVNSLNDFVADTIYSVMGVEPSPFMGEISPALTNIGDVSEAIVTFIIEHPPDPCLPTDPGGVPPEPCSELNIALMNLEDSATTLIDTVEWGQGLISNGCYPKDSEIDCAEGCEPTTDVSGVNYCCCNISVN